MRGPALVLLLALAACGGGEEATAAREPRPRVDSAVCDDLREVSALRAQGSAAGPDGRGVAARVSAAAERVLVQVGATPVVPEDVVSALRELEGGAGPDDGLDATVAAYVERECGGA